MHISKRMRCVIAMLAIAMTGCMSLAAEGTNNAPYEEPFTSLSEGSAITNVAGWNSSESDKSVITNLVGGYTSDASYPITNYVHTSNNKVLRLYTDGATLTNTIGNASFASAPIYVDTMVNFVLSDTVPTSISNDVGVKAAVYADQNSNVVVYCGSFDPPNTTYGPTQFVTTTNKVVPGIWYRLTISCESGIDGATYEQAIKVRVNNQAVWALTAYGDDWKTTFKTTSPGGGNWFLSAANNPASTDGSTAAKQQLNALAFSGTGMFDDLVVTNQEPVFASETWFVISNYLTGDGSANPMGPVSIKLNDSTQIVYTANGYYRITSFKTNDSPVTAANDKAVYTQDFNNVQGNISNDVVFTIPTRKIAQTVGVNGSGNANPPGDGDILIPNGSSTSITYNADNDWYTNTVTMGTYGAISGGANGTPSTTVTFTEVLADTSVSAVFTARETGSVVALVPTSYGLTYLGSGVTAAWAAANPDAMQTGYMLNINPTNVPTMSVDSIGIVDGTNLTVTVLLKDNGVAVNNLTINGTLRLYATSNLTNSFVEITSVALPGTTFDANGKRAITFIDVDTTKFYKAKVTLP